MFTFRLPFFYAVLLFATTTAQPYATDRFFLDCGSSSSSTTTSDPRWDGDQNSKFVPLNITTTSFPSTPFQPDSSVSGTQPYSTARIFNASFTYEFPVSQGPKFLRLYFYPATYSDLKPEQYFFSVSSNGFSLLTNFSASQTASFTPMPNSYAFINGIEIVSMPEDLYYNPRNPKPVGMTTAPDITHDKALENMYRLNMGGRDINGTQDTGMYRSWEQDNDYLFGSFGVTPLYQKPITYTADTPNYTAPEIVYQTQRSMGKLSDRYNLTWILSVDSGFYYYLRLHFCNIIPQYNKTSQVIFKIFINNQTADDEIDLFYLTQGSGYPVFKDYTVYVNDPDNSRGKQDLWVALHPNPMSQLYNDAYLNGLEAFKLSTDRSLASPNPELSPTVPPTGQTTTVKRNSKKPPNVVIVGGIGGALVLLSILVFIVFHQVFTFNTSIRSMPTLLTYRSENSYE